MKKYRYISALLLAASLAFGMITGCGKKPAEGSEAVTANVSAEELVRKAKATMDGASSMSAKMQMELSMDYSAQGADASFEMQMEQDMEMVREPEAVHMEGILDINLSGITLDTETYVVKENGKYVTYTGYGGQWMKQSSSSGNTSSDVSVTLALMLENPDGLLLGEPEQSDGKTLYTVEASVRGENMSEIMASAGTILEDSADAYSDLDAKAVLIMDAESGVPVSMTLDFTDSYNALFQSSKAEQGFDDVTVTSFKVTMSGYEINKVGAIIVPEEVKANAVDLDVTEDPTSGSMEPETKDPEEPPEKNYDVTQDETGNYILETDWDESTAVIGVPEGFVFDGSSDKTYLKFNSNGNDGVHDLSLVYGLYTKDDNYGEEDLAQYQESSYAYMTGVGDYAEVSFEPVQTVDAAGRTISYTKLSYLYLGTIYCEEYNAWTVLEDGRMIQCTITEEAREEACDRIDTETIFETAFSALRG